MKIAIREWMKSPKACAELLIGFITELVYVIINARIVLMLTDVIDHYDNYGPYLTKLIVFCVIQIGLMAVISLMKGYCRLDLYEKLENDYEDKILDSNYEMFTKLSCSRILTAAGQIWKIGALGRTTSSMLIQISTVVTLIASIYVIAPMITLPIAAVYGVGFLVLKKAFKKIAEQDKEAQEIVRLKNQEIDETINGFAEVRGFCKEERHRASIYEANRKITKLRKGKQQLNLGLNVIISMIDTIGMALAVIYGISCVTKGTMTPAIAMALVTYVWRIIDPLIWILDWMDEASENLSQMNEYDMVISYKNRNKDYGNIVLNEFEKEIVLRDIDFSYEDSTNVVSELSMTIKKGQKVGICGVSGGGKSTIFKLLTKYYNPSAGEIIIDGIPYDKINGKSIREKMGIVNQETHIFVGSIMDNITYACPDAPEYEVIEACKKANIYEFIQSLPEKFNTQVGPKGLKLSGGQKQRIALVRIFLKDPEIILLDEATSALDNESETLVQDALNKIEGKTVIAIAHRLSTIKDSDIIYVIGDHKVVEQGTHDQLMQKHGVYYGLNK